MLDVVKNALGFGTPAAPVPMPTKRDTLAAQIELERLQEPELDLLCRAGRRDPEELTQLRARIANLEKQLAKEEAYEIETIERATRLRELMPARIVSIREQLRERDALIEQLARNQADIEQTATAFEADFGNERRHVPPQAHDLIALCRRWSPEFGPRSHALTNYRARFARVVLGVKPPAPKPDPLDALTPAQRQALVDADRARKSRL
jgi:hypothetical protein